MIDPIIVGNVIQNCRQEKGVSQEVLSGFAGIGRTHLSAIERGERKPTLETFCHIAVALGMKSSELLSVIESKIYESAENFSDTK
ncbi:MAG: helix-turn-helix domain-containing protein [Clostridiales Family XIII bacterium]|nr:helix-turn-helix domain-containing protein [Clostridiales Family XIII bacterium]